MRVQIRLTAALAVLKLFTGVTPGRLFQIATRRSAGQAAASSASSFWLAKVSNGVAVVAAASSGGGKRRDVVVAVDRKRRHDRSPWCHALRGHHMDHSEVLEKQGNCAVKSTMAKDWRCARRGCHQMSGNVTKLKPKQEAAIAALLSNRSVEDAAHTVKIAPRTLYRWLKEADFDAAYRQARRSAFGQCVARLQQASSAAVSVMLKILADPSAPPPGSAQRTWW